MTPYDLYAQMLDKRAADAIIPGQVGAGANPGTTGSMDSDPATATNSNMSYARFEQNTAPLLASLDADGGAGYSHPQPGVGAGVQMMADVKSAAVIQQAEAFADYVYGVNKQANEANNSGFSDAAEAAPGRMQQMAGRLAETRDAFGAQIHAATGQAQEMAGRMGQHAPSAKAIGLGAVGLAGMGAAGYGAAQLMQQRAHAEGAEKAAGLNHAADAGRQFALQQLGLLR